MESYQTNFRVTAAVSDHLRLIFAHEVETGARFYPLEDTDKTGVGYIEARTPGIALPVVFTPQSSFALLGNAGMCIYIKVQVDSLISSYFRQNTFSRYEIILLRNFLHTST
jgi:hypothetical protein